MEKLVLENEYKIVVPLFGAAFAAPNKGTPILYSFRSLSTVLSSTENRKFKDFSRHLSDFPVLFKADLIFKDFSRKPSKFNYFSSQCKPWSKIQESPLNSSSFQACVNPDGVKLYLPDCYLLIWSNMKHTEFIFVEYESFTDHCLSFQLMLYMCRWVWLEGNMCSI